jgi:endonuclease G
VANPTTELLDADKQELLGRLGIAAPAVAADFAEARDTGATNGSFSGDVAEAIIVVDQALRPALVVRNNAFEQPTLKTWKTLLAAHRSKLEKALLSVGRLELVGHPTMPWAGTAWLIGDGALAVTNRHVGELFIRKQGKSFQFLKGANRRALKAKIDFREEFNVSASMEINVEKVLFLADRTDSAPDVCILKLENKSKLPDPIPLFDGRIRQNQEVAVIGYPASDPRNPASALATVFGDIFDVKRLAPGLVKQATSGFIFQHDCSTLGGNSGSVVLDIKTGRAVGLHFGGRFRQANFAVAAEQLKKILSSLKVQVAVPIDVEAPKKPKKLAADVFDKRVGYKEDFLGEASGHRVPLPGLSGDRNTDVTKVKGTRDNLLRYTHFSIKMSASRRMCHFAAVNIDGEASANVRRANQWAFDPRIPVDAQIGDELYAGNDLDRGHMVRRLDPVWGDEANVANADTFVFTNAAPQHARLNRQTWNDLEDHILTNTKAHGLKATVLTGPVFADDDPEFRDVPLPQQFWKVVAVVNSDNNKLHATAYVLSQKDLISDLEFVFGQFRTFQLPIAELEERTGLSFGKLSNFDPLKDQETFAIREITKLEDVVL